MKFITHAVLLSCLVSFGAQASDQISFDALIEKMGKVTKIVPKESGDAVSKFFQWDGKTYGGWKKEACAFVLGVNVNGEVYSGLHTVTGFRSTLKLSDNAQKIDVDSLTLIDQDAIEMLSMKGKNPGGMTADILIKKQNKEILVTLIHHLSNGSRMTTDGGCKLK